MRGKQTTVDFSSEDQRKAFDSHLIQTDLRVGEAMTAMVDVFNTNPAYRGAVVNRAKSMKKMKKTDAKE